MLVFWISPGAKCQKMNKKLIKTNGEATNTFLKLLFYIIRDRNIQSFNNKLRNKVWLPWLWLLKLWSGSG